MKKIIVILMMALSGTVCAELTNTDFEDGLTGWNTFGSGSGGSGHILLSAEIEPSGGSDGGQFVSLTTAEATNWGYNTLWPENNVDVKEGVYYAIGGHFKDLSGGAVGTIIYRWYNTNEQEIGDGTSDFPLTAEWVFCELAVQAPAGACTVKPMWSNRLPGVEFGLDEVRLVTYPVYDPDPTDEELVVPGLDILTWKRVNSSLLCTFEICEDCVPATFDVLKETLFVDRDVNSCTLSDWGFDVTLDHDYLWRVSCVDPNSGTPMPLPASPIWKFTTVPPSVLTILSEPNYMTTVPAAGEYVYIKNEVVSLQAVPYVDCPDTRNLNYWTGGVVDPNSASTTIVMDSDKTVTAVYSRPTRECGDACHQIVPPDLNGDCYVNMADFTLYIADWLVCTHPDCD